MSSRPSRRAILMALVSLATPWRAKASSANNSAANSVALHYFGARDCPYCQAFVREELAELRQHAEDAAIVFAFHETASLRDLHKASVFDEMNDLWLKVVRRSGYGVPAFALVDSGKFIDSRAGEWRELMVKAVARAGKA